MTTAIFKGRIVQVGTGPTGLSSKCDRCGRWIWITAGAALDEPIGGLICAKCAGNTGIHRRRDKVE